ncbi:PPC domain-containing protein, partial [Bacillus thuringiensis]
GIDIFKFSPSDTMKVEVTLQGMHNDFDLFVRNSKGKIIKKSLNLSNDMEKIVFEAEEWEDYYIEVSSSVRGNEDNNFD